MAPQCEIIEKEMMGVTSITPFGDVKGVSALESRMLAEMEEEQLKINQIQKDVRAQMKVPVLRMCPQRSIEEKEEADSRSVYVGNVDYSVTVAELESHFHGCGSIARVTIPTDKFSGNPKGFAYIEFTEKEGSLNALAMDESLLKERQIKVLEKRTNIRGISTTNRKPRGRGGFQGKGRGGYKGQQTVIVKYIYAGQTPRGGRTFKHRTFSAV